MEYRSIQPFKYFAVLRIAIEISKELIKSKSLVTDAPPSGVRHALPIAQPSMSPTIP